jgi:membrane protease YdiL (CAAX protease family)
VSTNWLAFAVAVSLLAVAVATLGREEDLSDERLQALPWRAVVANAAASQALFGALTLAAVFLAGVPLPELGLGADAVSLGALGLGVGLGVLLAAVNGGLSAVAERAGINYSEELRELLTPESPAGWAVLLGGVLPLVAAAEELLFRGALVLALSAGFPVSPWLLALASSAVFGLAHGAQGRVGAAAAGLFGFVLAASLLLTGSLLVPIIAHYVVNAAEFALTPR